MNEKGTMASFAALLMEYIICRAETTKVNALSAAGKTVVVIGDQIFQGKTVTETYDQMMLWLFSRIPTLTPEQYAQLAVEYDRRTDAESRKLIEDFTQDGLSDLGQAIETVRTERLEAIEGVLQGLSAKTMQGNFEGILKAVQMSQGLGDVDLHELWRVMAHRGPQFTAERKEATATGTLSGSTTKPN